MVNNGSAAKVTADAGVPVIDPCSDTDVWGEFMAATAATGAKSAASGVTSTTPTKDEAGRHEAMKRIGRRFALFGQLMGPGAVRIARSFRPDLVISTVEQWAGQLVASELDIPYVEQWVRFSRTGFDEESQRSSGVSRPVIRPAAAIDVRPPSLGGLQTDDHWLMRYIPYNGSAVLPEWVIAEPEQPRVCLTLGSVLPSLGGLRGVRDLVAGIAALDLDVVLALGEVDISELGELPANVRAVGWMPLGAVLPTCAAIVHHGGAGTCLTPMACGVPQLVVPRRFADQPVNAEIVAGRGLGIVLPPEEVTAETVRSALEQLLVEPKYAKTAGEVRAEMAELPSPADIVSSLAKVIR
ncbi:salmochelin biosynthesis C-glycosyltransferase IroB [Flindersiella endophytica]